MRNQRALKDNRHFFKPKLLLRPTHCPLSVRWTAEWPCPVKWRRIQAPSLYWPPPNRNQKQTRHLGKRQWYQMHHLPRRRMQAPLVKQMCLQPRLRNPTRQPIRLRMTALRPQPARRRRPWSLSWLPNPNQKWIRLLGKKQLHKMRHQPGRSIRAPIAEQHSLQPRLRRNPTHPPMRLWLTGLGPRPARRR